MKSVRHGCVAEYCCVCCVCTTETLPRCPTILLSEHNINCQITNTVTKPRECQWITCLGRGCEVNDHGLPNRLHQALNAFDSMINTAAGSMYR